MENQALLDKYQIDLDAAGMPLELRRDATGVTCKGHEIESGREVAVEFVPTRPLDAEMRKQIETDAIAAQQINHVNIPRLYDFAFDGKDLVYVTEYFDGMTAESWVTAHGPMPVRAVLHIALQVVSALGAATFQLVTHRAIHPGNLLIVSGQTTDGDAPLIKVLHFGRADPRFFIAGKKSRSINKAAPFASPEQLENGTVDFRSEIYSLGCTLWSLLTGVPPFNAPGKPLAGAQMAAAMKRFRGVPRKIRKLITQMAATDPDNRPLDPVVMSQQLQDCLASVVRRETIARSAGIPSKWQRRRVAKPVGPLTLRPLAIAAALVTAALCAFALTNEWNGRSLWEQFSHRGPIGTPIGVSENSLAASHPNAGTSKDDAKTAAREAALLQSLDATKKATSNSPSAPSEETAPVPTLAPPVVTSADQNAVEPSPNSVPNEQNDGTADPTITETPSPPATVAAVVDRGPAGVADPGYNKQNEPATVASSTTLSSDKVPRAELIEGPPSNLNQGAVPRAKLIEPPPPGEGPDEPKTKNAKETAASEEKMQHVPRAELIEPPPGQPMPQTRFKSSHGLSRSEIAAIRNASRRANQARIWADGDGAMVQTPAGMVHARLVGMTRDGQWMLALPSREIMIVPPPPGFVPP